MADFDEKGLPHIIDPVVGDLYVVHTFESTIPYNLRMALEQRISNMFYPTYAELYYKGAGAAENTYEYDVRMGRTLTAEETSALISTIQTWVQPTAFYGLDKTFSYPTTSEFVNAQTPVPIQTFININRRTPVYGLNAIKTILEYHCDDVQAFVGKSAGTLSIQLYDATRDWLMVNTTIDLSTIVTTWANEAASDPQNRPASVFRSIMIEDLWDKSVDYDTIWQIKMGVDDPNIKVRMHGLQTLYYNRLELV